MTQLNATTKFNHFKNFDSLTIQNSSTLALAFCKKDKKVQLSSKASKLSNGLSALINAVEDSKTFKGSHGQSLYFAHFALLSEKSPNNQDIICIGNGKTKDFLSQNLLHLGGKIAAKIQAHKIESIDVALDSFYNPASSAKSAGAPKDFAQRPLKNPPPTIEQTLEMLNLGILLGLYKFTQYKSSSKKIPAIKIRFISQHLNEKQGKAVCLRAEKIAKAVYAGRDMQTTPSNDLTPALLAKFAQKLAKETTNLKVQVFDEKKLKAEKFGGILAVGQGSINPSRLIIMDYNPTKKSNAKPVVLVGKGVTFDTGGTSLKPAPGMEAMKMDMSGAAATIAAVYGAALLKTKQRIIGIVPSAENRISHNSINPGDIYTAYNGKTVEVLNTDAEGRLILADALSYAAKFNPAAVIDLATLTGACVIALGAQASAIIGNDSKIIEAYAKASEKIGERTWEMPLYSEYADDLKSDIADYRNIGSNREAGTSKAACFLNFFVDNQYPWAHLDIAATADIPRGQGAHCPEHVGTGVPVRGLIEFCENFSSYVKS